MNKLQEANKKLVLEKSALEKVKRIRVELVEDKYTGTLYEMEIEEEDDECPVIREARK